MDANEIAALLASRDWQALLGAIRANPADDTPRLVAADKLEDWGLERAAHQFRGRHPTTCGQGLRWRTNGTWAGTPYDGFPMLPVLDGIMSAYIGHRGMVEEAECSTAEWLKSGPVIVRHPLACVTEVRLMDREPHCGQIHDGELEGRTFWGWLDAGIFMDFSEHFLAAEIWHRIPVTPLVHKWKPFDSAELAHAAITPACLKYAWETEMTP